LYVSDLAFISYAREDSSFANQVAADLKAAKAEVWMDQLEIQAGQRRDSLGILTDAWTRDLELRPLLSYFARAQ
jgi:hypothetical protein